MADKLVIADLNDLIAVCNDNIESLEEATEHVKAQDLRKLLNELAEHWKKIAEALRSEVIYRDGTPTDSGTVVGEAHRLFARFKAALLSNERQAILDELEQLSHRALDKFAEKLGRGLPPQVEGIIQLQRGQVSAAHERILEQRRQGA